MEGGIWSKHVARARARPVYCVNGPWDCRCGAFNGDLRNRRMAAGELLIWWSASSGWIRHPLCVVARRVWTTQSSGDIGGRRRRSVWWRKMRNKPDDAALSPLASSFTLPGITRRTACCWKARGGGVLQIRAQDETGGSHERAHSSTAGRNRFLTAAVTSIVFWLCPAN